MKVEYELTEDDLVNCRLHHQRNAARLSSPSDGWRRFAAQALVHLIYFVLLIALPITLILSLAANWGFDERDPALAVFVCGYLLLLLLSLGVLAMNRRRIEAWSVRMAARRGYGELPLRCVAETTPEALSVFSADVDCRIRWRGVRRITWDDEEFYIHYATSSPYCVVIPRRAFADDAEAQEFLKEIQGCFAVGRSHAAAAKAMSRIDP